VQIDESLLDGRKGKKLQAELQQSIECDRCILVYNFLRFGHRPVPSIRWIPIYIVMFHESYSLFIACYVCHCFLTRLDCARAPDNLQYVVGSWGIAAYPGRRERVGCVAGFGLSHTSLYFALDRNSMRNSNQRACEWHRIGYAAQG